MDTTAAAELGMGELDAAAPSSDQWRDHGEDEFYDDEDDDGVQQVVQPGFGRGRAPGGEPLQKAARAMSDGNGRGHAPPASSPSFVGSSPGAGAVGRGRGMGSIFYKTKLCSRFRSGNCPYNTNCNFAHGMEELRKPPPGWEEFVASQELPPPPPSQPSGSSDSQVRFHKTRPCKKYFGEGNCPYGEKCNFLHEEQSVPRAVREAREAAVAAAVAGASGGGVVADSFKGEPVVQGTNGNSSKETGGAVASTPAGSTTSNVRPSNWKTRLCNKWETTGHCPFVDKCHFAHGSDELQRFGGGLPDSRSPALSDSKSGGTPSRDSSSHQRHQGGASSARSGSKGSTSWRGPNEISTIYGDWWVEEDDDDDWQCGVTTTSYESTEHEGDVSRETQRRTPLPAPSPKTAPLTRRTNSWEPSRQNPSLINGCSSISQQDGAVHKQAFPYEGMKEGAVLHPERAWRSELR